MQRQRPAGASKTAMQAQCRRGSHVLLDAVMLGLNVYAAAARPDDGKWRQAAAALAAPAAVGQRSTYRLRDLDELYVAIPRAITTDVSIAARTARGSRAHITQKMARNASGSAGTMNRYSMKSPPTHTI